jgi:hypothetical protein
VRSIRPTLPVAAIAAAALISASMLPAAAQSEAPAQAVLDWNVNALKAIGTAGQPPTSANLTLGMVHGAMYDAVISIVGGYEPYLGAVEAPDGASPEAAAAAAAHGLLLALFPDQTADLDAAFATSLESIADGQAETDGVDVGHAAAAAMLAARTGDHRGEPYTLTYVEEAGGYRPTPPDFKEYGDSGVAKVTPFLAPEAAYYRTEGPPALDSAEYAAEYDEVKSLGAMEGSTRTPEQDAIAAFWKSPLPQWASVERSLAVGQGLDVAAAARLFAIANLAAADAAIGCFDDKHHWMFWRPSTAIAEGESDGNPATVGDPAWLPLAGSDPPYPDHPSGFNCYAGAHAGALRAVFGTDEMAFSVISLDEGGEPRPYTSFSQALDECIEARILQGIHFRSADEQAAALGMKAAALAVERLAPVE